MPSVCDQYAYKMLRNFQDHTVPPTIPFPEPPRPRITDEPIIVGIIGAGVAGLFTAMLLERAIKDHGLNIKYEILEAETVQGGHPFSGRLWTHRFSDLKNDYHVRLVTHLPRSTNRRAMWFPDIPWTKPVMDLFTALRLDNVKIPYILSIDENLNFFNDKSLTNASIQISAKKGKYNLFNTNVPGINGTTNDMVKRQIKPFRNALKDNFDKGFEALMKYDT